MKHHPGVYDTSPEANEFPHGPVIEMDNGKCIYFDLYMEEESSVCFKALSALEKAS